MSGGGLQANGVGTAASGGKGGTMGGFDQAQKIGGQGGMMSGGKGGDGFSGMAPPVINTLDGPQIAPMGPPGANAATSAATDANPMGPNAFETGLNAMNSGMDWFGNAMGYTSPRLNGDYGVLGINGADYLGQMGQASGGGYKAAMMSAPDKSLYDYNPAMSQGQSYQAAQLADKDINAYMNPYTQNVIDTTLADLGRARDDAMNATGVAATRGGAFGGDRHAIMESQNNADYMRQAASTSAQLRNQGYQNAQQAAMGDVGAINAQRGMNAQMAQQSNLANQAANNSRSQFVGGLASQNAMQQGLANQKAQNDAAALGAQLGSQASIANARDRNAMLSSLMGYENDNQQFNASMNMNRDQFNAGQAQRDFANQMAAAQGMYDMGGDRWQMGQDALSSMNDVGQRIDSTNQTLLDQYRSEFDRLTGAPQDQYQQMLGALSALSGGGTTTSQYNPGMFDYLKAGTSLFGLGK